MEQQAFRPGLKFRFEWSRRHWRYFEKVRDTECGAWWKEITLNAARAEPSKDTPILSAYEAWHLDEGPTWRTPTSKFFHDSIEEAKQAARRRANYSFAMRVRSLKKQYDCIQEEFGLEAQDGALRPFLELADRLGEDTGNIFRKKMGLLVFR